MISETCEGDQETFAFRAACSLSWLRAGSSQRRGAPAPQTSARPAGAGASRCHVRGPTGGIPAPRKTQMCSSFGVICLWGEEVREAERRSRYMAGGGTNPRPPRPLRPPFIPRARPTGRAEPPAAEVSRPGCGLAKTRPGRLWLARCPPGLLRRARGPGASRGPGLAEDRRGRPSPSPAQTERTRFLLLIGFLTLHQPPK